MSVAIEPAELGFRRPFTVEVSETLKIKNPNATPVAFKVKTTAPKQYCVRPNSGRIEPNREVEVTVLLQAMKHDPPADFKCRDKFLVQSVPITGDKEFVPIQEIWDKVEKSDVQEKKIRVVFLPAEDPDALPTVATPARQIVTNGVGTTPEPAALSFVSPREEYQGANSTLVADESSPERKSSHRSPSSTLPATPAPNPSLYGATAAAPVTPSASITATTATDKDTIIAALTAKLSESEALISSLRKDGGLRQRKGASTTTDVSEKSAEKETAPVTAQVQQASFHGTEGVQVQVVAMLCLLSFLLAYFFF